jgi:hypothetical protein
MVSDETITMKELTGKCEDVQIKIRKEIQPDI